MPVDFPAVLALGVLALACQKRFAVQVSGVYVEVLALFAALVAFPSERKSGAFAHATSPALAWESGKHVTMKPKIAEAKAKVAVLSRRITNAEKAAAKAAAEGAETATPVPSATEGKDKVNVPVDWQQEASECHAALDEVQIPVQPRLFTSNGTPEVIEVRIAEQGGRFGVMSAEPGILGVLAGRYSEKDAPDIDVFLKGWGGETLATDRLSRPGVFVPAAHLTVVLTLQPSVLEEIGKQKRFDGRGLTARFLWVYPDSNVGSRDANPPQVEASVTEHYAACIQTLLDVVDIDGEGDRLLRLDDDARAVRVKLHDEIEPLLHPDGDYAEGTMGFWLGKLCGTVVRIAGLLHIAKFCPTYVGNPDQLAIVATETPISGETMEAAVKIGECLRTHAVRAFESMGDNPARVHARRLLHRIRAAGDLEKVITSREAMRIVRTIRTAEEASDCLQVLIDHGYLRPVPRDKEKPGRPSDRFRVNPMVWEASS